MVVELDLNKGQMAVVEIKTSQNKKVCPTFTVKSKEYWKRKGLVEDGLTMEEGIKSP